MLSIIYLFLKNKKNFANIILFINWFLTKYSFLQKVFLQLKNRLSYIIHGWQISLILQIERYMGENKIENTKTWLFLCCSSCGMFRSCLVLLFLFSKKESPCPAGFLLLFLTNCQSVSRTRRLIINKFTHRALHGPWDSGLRPFAPSKRIQFWGGGPL